MIEPRAIAHVSIALALGACGRCKSGAGSSGDGSAAPAKIEVGAPRHVDAPAFAALEGAKGYGLPAGCALDDAIRVAPLGQGTTRFAAAGSDLDALVLARAGDAGSAVSSAGIVNLARGRVGDAPWAELDAPPAFEHASSGFVAAWTVSAGPAMERAILWRASGKADTLAEGDGLQVFDLACRADACAILTTTARSAAAPGATLFVGTASAPSASYRRVDFLPSGDEPWHPLSIAAFDGKDSGVVALASPSAALLMEFHGEKAESRDRIMTPEGAYGAVMQRTPLVVAPGAAPDRPCGREEFPVLVLGPNGRRHELRTPAPPESMIVRPLGQGAIAVWVAPVSCQYLERRVVYAALIAPDGTVGSSPMAIADASGFALATDGAKLSLWLLRDRELAWLRARCD
jgi:hypothetical protein